MLEHLRRSVVLALICLVLFGLVYGFVGTGVAQLLFKHQADGSITANGSTLIGQNWTATSPPRPQPQWSSTAGPTTSGPTRTTRSSANGKSGGVGRTNLGPRSKVLLANTKALVGLLAQARGEPDDRTS